MACRVLRDETSWVRLTGVLGASSLVGHYLLPLLLLHDRKVVAFSRKRREIADLAGVRWQCLNDDAICISEWVCLAPIWVLPDYFQLLQSASVSKLVVLSSTSRFSKLDSSSDKERALAARLADAERRVRVWAKEQGVQWVILRPTMIYGDGLDRNVSDIARFLRRWRFFPLVGNGSGLRQPVHAADVAEYCAHALLRDEASNRAFDVCGGETLNYRDMVTRIAAAMGLPAHFVTVPRSLLRSGVRMLSLLPRFRALSPALIDRMAQDLVFDGSDANRILDVKPRGFVLMEGDLPSP